MNIMYIGLCAGAYVLATTRTLHNESIGAGTESEASLLTTDQA